MKNNINQKKMYTKFKKSESRRNKINSITNSVKYININNLRKKIDEKTKSNFLKAKQEQHLKTTEGKIFIENHINNNLDSYLNEVDFVENDSLINQDDLNIESADIKNFDSVNDKPIINQDDLNNKPEDIKNVNNSKNIIISNKNDNVNALKPMIGSVKSKNILLLTLIFNYGHKTKEEKREILGQFNNWNEIRLKLNSFFDHLDLEDSFLNSLSTRKIYILNKDKGEGFLITETEKET